MARKIKITENELKNIVATSVKKILTEAYSISDNEEIMEYMWLKPSVTNLNVDVFVDDGFSYKRHNHHLVLLARNGYEKTISEFIVFSVSNKPIILNPEIEYNISYNDIFAIQDFIVSNLSALKMLADEEISHNVFLQNVNVNVPHYMFSENKNIILEMATLRAKDSNLPMDIWLDEGATYQGHAPRLKFRASNEQKTTREFSSMLLTNPPTIENFPDNSPIKTKDLEQLKNFVINNLEMLLMLANGQIDYTTQFLPNIKK